MQPILVSYEGPLGAICKKKHWSSGGHGPHWTSGCIRNVLMRIRNTAPSRKKITMLRANLKLKVLQGRNNNSLPRPLKKMHNKRNQKVLSGYDD